MADSYAKLWVQDNLNQTATNRALEVMQNSGLGALPVRVTAVSGSMVTVKFEVTGPWTLPPVTIPKAESQWVRAPTQVGDYGTARPAGTFLGGISGQGSGVADPTVNYGNLTNLEFVPLANVNFGAPPDPNRAWINGPSGADMSDTGMTARSTVSQNHITHVAGIGTSSQVRTIYDGTGNAISHIVSSGGLVGLGALASSISSTQAVVAHADLQTLANNIVATTLQTLSTAIGAAAVTSSLGPGAAAFSAILSASGFVTGLSGINPTIPTGSSLVRVAP